MKNGAPPQSEYAGIAAQFAAAKAKRDEEGSRGLRDTVDDGKQREREFTVKQGMLMAWFGIVIILHVLGLYLFTSGFLLTRPILDDKSKCDVPPIDLANSAKLGSPENGCWHPKAFDKAVIIIIDALRYDFTVPFQAVDGDHKPKQYHNSLRVLYDTAQSQPQNAVLLPFIADPPTATLQRLKGLTTGTLPTFIDVGSNFAGTAIDEDNMIAQLRNASKRVVHLGDDTWHALFPGYFDPNLTHAYDSFNVWDLHTVDNGVIEHLEPLLRPENVTKWDVLIGHLLGVDHAGHRYGPDHPAMATKLVQMEGFVKSVMNQVDDKTLLIVMGDHGMDSKGDHGGESDDEVEAALWLYSKRPMFGRREGVPPGPSLSAKEQAVAQIDLVPTLSLLLGIPIPFNNLGAPIYEAFAGPKRPDYENLARVFRLTAAQISRYMKEYSRVRNLDSVVTTQLNEYWNSANLKWQGGAKSSTSWREIYPAFELYQKETLDLCKSLWARFDIHSMIHGIAVLSVSLAILAVYARGVEGDPTDLTPALVKRSGVGLLLGASIGTGLGIGIPSIPLVHSIALLTAVGGIIGSLSGFFYAKGRLTSPFPKSTLSWVVVIFTIALSGGFASNSYTIWEDRILLFLITSCSALLLASSLRQEKIADRALGAYHSILFAVLTRFASFSRLCREEQMPYCVSTYYASSSSSTSAVWQLLIPITVALALPAIVKDFYQSTKSYHHSAILWYGFAFRGALWLSVAYWTLNAADDNDWAGFSSKPWVQKVKIMLAQITLGISLTVGYSIYAWAAPFLAIETQKIPEQVKGQKPAPAPLGIISADRSSRITILGYANVHGTRYFFLVTIWTAAIILLQKPMGGGSIAILCWQILSLLEVLHANNLRSSAIGPILLALLGSFHFFTTGHQAVLSSIQWDVAFIPLSTIRYPWTPILIVLNSFGAQILTALAVPATVLWKMPPKQPRLLGDVARASATHLLFYATVALATSMWAGHLRRHLMLYRVFSPRFLTAMCVLGVVDVVVVVVGIAGTRWSFLSVGEVFGVNA